jgi:hypothetical protein
MTNTTHTLSDEQTKRELPPLPENAGTVFDDGSWLQNKGGPLASLPRYASRRSDFFTADQMRNFAHAAIEAHVLASHVSNSTSVADVAREVNSACANWPPFNSAHEGFVCYWKRLMS